MDIYEVVLRFGLRLAALPFGAATKQEDKEEDRSMYDRSVLCVTALFLLLRHRQSARLESTGSGFDIRGTGGGSCLGRGMHGFTTHTRGIE